MRRLTRKTRYSSEYLTADYWIYVNAVVEDFINMPSDHMVQDNGNLKIFANIRENLLSVRVITVDEIDFSDLEDVGIRVSLSMALDIADALCDELLGATPQDVLISKIDGQLTVNNFWPFISYTESDLKYGSIVMVTVVDITPNRYTEDEQAYRNQFQVGES